MQRIRRLLRVLTLVLPLFLVASQSSPASAATAASAGAVTGTVHVSPGIMALSQSGQSFSFNGVVIAGNFTAVDGTNAATYDGTINVPTITGGSSCCEDVVGGSGTVNPFSFSGANPTSPTAGTSITGTATDGTYVRVGGAVWVRLWVCATVIVSVNPPLLYASATACGWVTVIAWFQAITGDGVTAPITDAAFAGTFSSST